MRRLTGLAILAAATACAGVGARGPMQRALDPSMERALGAESYVGAVSGITGDARRFARSDGFVYLADVAPALHHLGLTGDTESYRRLRQFVETSMIVRDTAGARPRRRVRGGSPLEPATPYAVRRLGDALALGWQGFGDTASAVLAASLRPGDSPEPRGSATDRMVEECMAAEASLRSDAATARGILAGAKHFRGGEERGPASSLDLRGGDADLVALACLTRLALAVRDPDATVRFLDRMLDLLKPLMAGSGRPDPGAAAEVLLALREVRAAGPPYYSGR